MKKFWTIFILICVVLSLFLIVTLIPRPTDKDVIYVKDNEKESLHRVFINNNLLSETQNNLILLENNNIVFSIEGIDIINTSVSLNSSLNVLFDEFYGETIIEDNKITFVPDFAIPPGHNKLEIKDLGTSDTIVSYKFVIVFREMFDVALNDNLLWIIPDEDVKEWFAVYDNKLHVAPKEGAGHASVAYLHKLEGNFSVDLELVPLGDNVSTVLYLIGQSCYEFVLGSNSNRFNFTFFTELDDDGQIQGKDFLFQVGRKYHIRLVKKGQIISILARELHDGDVVDYELLEEQFTVLLENTSKDTVYNFGISVWQNSKGVEIGDVYIISHGFQE